MRTRSWDVSQRVRKLTTHRRRRSDRCSCEGRRRQLCLPSGLPCPLLRLGHVGAGGRRSWRVLPTVALVECFKCFCLFSPQTVLGRSVGLPAPLGEPDRSNEEGEPERPRRQQYGPAPALGIQKREAQEQTVQQPSESICSPAS